MAGLDSKTVAPPAHPQLRYKRILLKLSGEALAGTSGGGGIDPETLRLTASELAELHAVGVQIGIVVGGGNIFRGLKGASQGMDRAQSDSMGMLATVINGLALQDALEQQGVPTRMMSAIEMNKLAEPYIRRRAITHLSRGRLCIFAAGTGNPFFSTDTAAALRAMEISADVLFKATKVDGIYDKDPVKHADAKMFSEMSYQQFIEDRIAVMDATAVTLCRENNMQIRVFKLTTRGNVKRVCLGEELGTVVREEVGLGFPSDDSNSTQSNAPDAPFGDRAFFAFGGWARSGHRIGSCKRSLKPVATCPPMRAVSYSFTLLLPTSKSSGEHIQANGGRPCRSLPSSLNSAWWAANWPSRLFGLALSPCLGPFSGLSRALSGLTRLPPRCSSTGLGLYSH